MDDLRKHTLAINPLHQSRALIREQDKKIAILQAEVDRLVELAKDFIVQNELQGSRMEVAEYDTLKDAVFGCAEQE